MNGTVAARRIHFAARRERASIAVPATLSES